MNFKSHHHIQSEFRPGWPISVSAVISSSSLLSGRPGRRLPLDDNSEAVLGARCLPFYEHVGTTCVCMYIICLLRVLYGVLLFFCFFCG
jgi:hypothetical protein